MHKCGGRPHDSVYNLCWIYLKLIVSPGGYIYLEASLHTSGEKTRLLSGYMTGTQCLTFKYHMMGPGTGSLRINQINKKHSLPRMVWSRLGDQGEDWIEAQFNLFGNVYRVRLYLCIQTVSKQCVWTVTAERHIRPLKNHVVCCYHLFVLFYFFQTPSPSFSSLVTFSEQCNWELCCGNLPVHC